MGVHVYVRIEVSSCRVRRRVCACPVAPRTRGSWSISTILAKKCARCSRNWRRSKRKHITANTTANTPTPRKKQHHDHVVVYVCVGGCVVYLCWPWRKETAKMKYRYRRIIHFLVRSPRTAVGRLFACVMLRHLPLHKEHSGDIHIPLCTDIAPSTWLPFLKPVSYRYRGKKQKPVTPHVWRTSKSGALGSLTQSTR